MRYLLLIVGVMVIQGRTDAQVGGSAAQGRLAAAQKLPVIKAGSKKVSIRDGEFFDRDAWNLSPTARPDVYTADRTRKAKWVTFYTDMDSIRVRVKPGGRYDFVILWNGKDSCYTRIVSAIPPTSRRGVGGDDAGNGAGRNGADAKGKTDTIPFALTEYNAIAAKAVINGVDTVSMHFDVGSFGFHLTKEVLGRKPSLGKVRTLQMGTRVWDRPDIGVTGFTAHDMDGRFGWDLFEGQQVEIDYDHNLLIIHPRLPGGLKGYVREKLLFQRNYVCIKGDFGAGEGSLKGKGKLKGEGMLTGEGSLKGKGKLKGEGCFMLDTGSDQAAIVDSGWAAAHHFADGLKLIKTTVLKDPRGVKYETKTLLAPRLDLRGIRLSNVPTLVLSGRNPTGLEVNFLGNDLLKRFNIILDFQHDHIYLKPNHLMGAPYRANS